MLNISFPRYFSRRKRDEKKSKTTKKPQQPIDEKTTATCLGKRVHSNESQSSLCCNSIAAVAHWSSAAPLEHQTFRNLWKVPQPLNRICLLFAKDSHDLWHGVSLVWSPNGCTQQWTLNHTSHFSSSPRKIPAIFSAPDKISTIPNSKKS